MPTVPEQNTGISVLFQSLMVSPYLPAWTSADTVTNIPAESVGWLVAQGWRITGISYDATTTPPTPYYALSRASLNNFAMLQSMLDEYVFFYNEAITHNAVRYNDIIVSWSEMLHTSHDQFEVQFDEQDGHETLYLTDLTAYMDEIDTLIAEQLAELTILETNYTLHESTATTFLTDLGATELARINEEFAARLSQQLQQLSDRGLYSSAIATDIEERNTRDRDEQIQALNDRLMREQLENHHRLYGQQTEMKAQKMDEKTKAIAGKLTEAKERLNGLQQKHDEVMKLMAYQLDERNKILVGIYAFSERREDAYPSFEALTQLAIGLGDSGALVHT